MSPVNAGSYGRSNWAAYVDVATNLWPHWQVDVAGRHEHFTDFGNTTSGKLSTRYDFSSRFGLRGTVSNGFRAPSLAQEFYASLGVSPTGKRADCGGITGCESARGGHPGAGEVGQLQCGCGGGAG
ncbi:MAG: TonB-dependent receptor domain-containing protein [Steroidobacteraceae bacterium]